MPFTSLTCWRYIDLNPVRAGMVAAPDAYSWSSYSRDALGEPSALVQPHGQYLALGATAEARCAAWREFCAEATDDRQIDELRACLQTGTPLGTERFRQAIELTLQRRVGVARRGRPRQEAAEAVGLSPKGSLDLGTGPSCLGQGPRKDAGLVHELMFSVEAQPVWMAVRTRG